MPVQNAGDSLSSLITFRTSPVFEMLTSLGGVAASWRLTELTAEVQAALGRVFVDEVKSFYEDFFSCCSLLELAIDYRDHHDVEGFLSYVESMTDSNFAFYALGRWIPRSKFEEGVSSERTKKLFEESPDREALEQHYPQIGWLDDIPGLKNRIIGVWKQYWDGFCKRKVSRYEPEWRRSILEKQRILDAHGGAALIEQLTDCGELPGPLPPDQPYTRIEIIPICNAERAKTVYYGYGNIHILYDCARTEEHEREVQASGERSLAALKALADENRLKILKLISQNERFLNGKSLAKKLDLSASVVSRHLAQLKSAGFIKEYSPDNRNISYNFDLERLRAVSTDLEAFIKD